MGRERDEWVRDVVDPAAFGAARWEEGRRRAGGEVGQRRETMRWWRQFGRDKGGGSVSCASLFPFLSFFLICTMIG